MADNSIEKMSYNDAIAHCNTVKDDSGIEAALRQALLKPKDVLPNFISSLNDVELAEAAGAIDKLGDRNASSVITALALAEQYDCLLKLAETSSVIFDILAGKSDVKSQTTFDGILKGLKKDNGVQYIDSLIAAKQYAKVMVLVDKGYGNRKQLEQLRLNAMFDDAPVVLVNNKGIIADKITDPWRYRDNAMGQILGVQIECLLNNLSNPTDSEMITREIVRAINQYANEKSFTLNDATAIINILISKINDNPEAKQACQSAAKQILAAVVNLPIMEKAGKGARARVFGSFFNASSTRLPDTIKDLRATFSSPSGTLSSALDSIAQTHPEQTCPDSRHHETHEFYQALHSLLGSSCLNVAGLRAGGAPTYSYNDDGL